MLDSALSLAQDYVPSGLSAAGSIGSFFGGIIGYVIAVIALWPVFTKAGRPGWGAIIPIYNAYLLTKIAGYHGATLLLFLIPVVNVVWAVFIAYGVAKAFGKGLVFSFFLLWLFALIGYLILGYGSSRYLGDGGDPSKRVTSTV
ncbi:hypothetical protein SAMN06295885_3493 [Rathayibacter oskolensis]|uniref:Signal peptidase I n=1 Tax=Rathayibacter oskolensis TaxID=1891671 RepID=A0A1X7PI29_9MICO|nr:DUF5684 domain-containing protein [Rathayibacter oskolensis]SMH50252.1 hypothetical protein SAMN06295885_3493 [Rathayibacter oskolensis]